MNLTIHPDRVLLDGHDLLKLRESGRFLACFGNPSRRRDIPMHPGGTRIAMVWDELGLVAYEDRPEGLMSHLILAFDTEDTPENPTRASDAIIEINGGTVTGETLEGTLPRNGSTPILAGFGKHFSFETDAFCVHFEFKRRANAQRRHPVIGRLVHVSFSWRQQVSTQCGVDSRRDSES